MTMKMPLDSESGYKGRLNTLPAGGENRTPIISSEGSKQSFCFDAFKLCREKLQPTYTQKDSLHGRFTKMKRFMLVSRKYQLNLSLDSLFFCAYQHL